MLYADYNATAPIMPEVFEAMKPFLSKEYGNPSSNSSLGKTASKAVEKAREQVASLINAKTSEIVFVSGGTESCFQALMGAFLAREGQQKIVSARSEHNAVVRLVELLAEKPFTAAVDYLQLMPGGSIDLQAASDKLNSADIVSLMYANNETGLIHPIKELRDLSESIFHCDATQALGKIEVDFSALDVDLLSCSGHKIGAPKGVGALVIKSGTPWKAPMLGGAQENGRRGGTLAVANIVGFGAAAELAKVNLEKIDVSTTRDAFEREILNLVEGVEINCADCNRIPNTSSIYIPGVVSHEAVDTLAGRNVIVSAGSACNAKGLSYSHVLKAIGQSELRASGTLRVSFGPSQTIEDAQFAAKAIAEYARQKQAGTNAELELLLSE